LAIFNGELLGWEDMLNDLELYGFSDIPLVLLKLMQVQGILFLIIAMK
jgi:hypothetical protein